MTGPDFIELRDTGSMIRTVMIMMVPTKLKYDQIVSVVEAAMTAPTLSGAVLRRDLMDHESPTKSIRPQLQRCVQRIFQNVRKQVTH